MLGKGAELSIEYAGGVANQSQAIRFRRVAMPALARHPKVTFMLKKSWYSVLLGVCFALWFAACSGESQHRTTATDGGTGAQAGADASGTGGAGTGGQATGGGGAVNLDSGADAGPDSGSSCNSILVATPDAIPVNMSVVMEIYGSGPWSSIQNVEIAPHGSTTRQTVGGLFRDLTRPNWLEVTLPGNLTASAYDLYVTESGGCEAGLQNAFTVTGSTALTLVSIDPAFGLAGTDTPVTIKATGGLTATPRVYLKPQAGGGAIAARAVVWVDSTTLTALAPKSLTAGMYDVVVIDPDGSIGVLSGAAGFRVTSTVPQISNAAPSSIYSATVTLVTLSGSGFSAAATVTMSCVDSAGVPQPDQQITPTGVSAVGDSLTFNTPALAASTVCAITVSNPDGTFGTFPRLTVTSPASDIEPFQSSDTAPSAVKALGTPRRALALLAGHVTGTQPYLYAIGGDNGALTGAMPSIEATPIDQYGRTTGWAPLAQGTQPRNLNGNRTFAQGARVGQYLYVAGGNDGTNVLATIVRARILDPSNVPQLIDLDFTADATTQGLGAGNWVYQISAVMPNDGETLPSEPINVAIPDLSALGMHVKVTLTWPGIGTGEYKIYRTRAANDPAATVAFLTNASTTSFTDDGSATPAISALPPLAVGALGDWSVVGTMSTPRMGAAVTAAQGATANNWYLYIGGGNDGSQALDSYEYLPITISTDGTQTVGTVATGAKTIGMGRWKSSAWTVDASVTSNAGSNCWVYFGTGENAAGTSTVAVTGVGQVDAATGELTSGAASTLDLLIPASVHSGTGAVATNGFLFDFGGGPTPSAGGSFAQICGSGVVGCTTTTPPELTSWNGLSPGGVLTPRYLASAVLESGFIFVAGGYGGLSGTEVLTSVERTIR